MIEKLIFLDKMCADLDQLEAAVQSGARVQLVGYQARNLALWPTWAAFEAAIA